MILEAILVSVMVVGLKFVLGEIRTALLLSGLLAIGVSYFWLGTMMTASALIGGITTAIGVAAIVIKIKA